MLYEELLVILKENDIDPKKLSSILGYHDKSIDNNWKNPKDENKQIPEAPLKTLDYYIELQKEKQKNKELKQDIENLNNESDVVQNISAEALKIARKKCSQHNLKLEDYLSSLIMSNI